MKRTVAKKAKGFSALSRDWHRDGKAVRSRANENPRDADSNILRVRIPWLFEVESVGLIPVVAAFLLCAMVIAGLAFRW